MLNIGNVCFGCLILYCLMSCRKIWKRRLMRAPLNMKHTPKSLGKSTQDMFEAWDLVFAHLKCLGHRLAQEGQCNLQLLVLHQDLNMIA